MSYQQTEVNSLSSECFEMDFSENNAIKLSNVISILNSEGEKLKPYNVTIKNICDNDIKYQVNIETLNNEDKLADKYITAKVNYEENKVLTEYQETTGIIENHSKAYKVYEGHLKKDQVMSIDVRMWMGEEVELYETVDGVKVDKSKEIMNKEFQSKVTIEAEVENQEGEYKEEILNGADPVIKGDLIPVIINNDGSVTRADTNKKWYNYANSEWANAVILAEGKKDPGASQPISEDDIESYFVWIPKYSYQLWDLGLHDELTEVDESKVHTIPIKFGTTDTDDDNSGECTTPMTEDGKQGKSGDSGKCKVGDFMTHPAFLSFGVNGLWVGKFETGYKDAKSVSDVDNSSITNKIALDQIVIKPNVYAWKSINVANAFQNAYEYQREQLDSHLIKNTEWGAVAYLSHSKYGKYTVKDGNTEIRFGNNDSVTGYAANFEPSCGFTGSKLDCNKYDEEIPGQDGDNSYNYKNPKSVIASTTGNYSGIYDMSGGGLEYTMSLMTNIDGTELLYGNSGLDESILSKGNQYYDKYNYGTELFLHYNRRILGDATGEMGPFAKFEDNQEVFDKRPRYQSSWHNDDSGFVKNNNPVFARGQNLQSGSQAGIFAFLSQSGGAVTWCLYRIVLAPAK